MSQAAVRDRLGVWCGWVLTGAAFLAPLLVWIGPLGFAPLLGLAGLLCLPALRITDEDRPVAVVLLAGLVWAAASSAWSPFRPQELEDNVALKLSLQLPLYWAAFCGARRADPKLQRMALSVFAWGMSVVGALFLLEAFTGGAAYRAFRDWYEPTRPDLARKHLAHGSFALALLWPVAAAGGVRAGQPWWLAIPPAAGAAILAFLFLSDAPVLALGLSLALGLCAWVWPRGAPKALGLVAAGFFLLAPAVMLGVRSVVRTLGVVLAPPDSWAQRLGYWSHAVDWISDHPVRGWGLDASRVFGPGIQLHPHNGALQVWLELGAIGGACAALFWALALRRLSRERRDIVIAGAMASTGAYLLFGAANFGVWQEWWLACGALVAVVVALASGEISPSSARQRRRSAAKSSTAASLSG